MLSHPPPSDSSPSNAALIQQPQPSSTITRKGSSSSSSSSSNSFRRVSPFLFVVTAAVATIWTATQQQIGLSITNSHSSDGVYSSNIPHQIGMDVWLPGETVERIRNVSATAAAAASIFPLPHFTKESVVVLVMSARKHIEHRRAIRTTWAKNHDNVYFLLAAPCPYPPSQRTNSMECQRRRRENDNTADESDEYAKRLRWEHDQLLQEQANHHDIIYLGNATESYRGLPHKLKEAYDWVLQQFEYQHHQGATSMTIRWLVKVDDDTVVRVATLQHMLTRYNADIPMVIGRIIPKSQVWREGKWAEFPQYKRRFYPYWPQGSCGHVVSRPVAAYLSHNKQSLFNYQGEDTSLGIWLDESPYMKNQTMWVHTPYFINEGDCANPDWIIMGHEIKAQKMKDCYQQGDEARRIRAWFDQRAEFTQPVDFVESR